MSVGNEHKGHRQRVRKRFIENGLDGFEVHEALELLLFYTVPRCDTNPLAHRLIDHFGSLSAVFDAPIDALTKFGISENSAVLLKMIPEYARLYQDDKYNNGSKVIDFDNLGEKLKSKFIGRTTEVLVLLLIDSKGKELFCGVISKGSLNSTDVPIRKVVDYALRYNAKVAVIAHNHPSGVAVPSREDIMSTSKLYDALKLVGINLIDHIIFADDDYVSLADSKYDIRLF